MFKSLTTIKKREEGQGLVEYALILVLVAVVVIVVLSLVGPGVGNIFSEVVGALNAGASGEAAEELSNGGCKGYGGVWMIVDGDGGVRTGTETWLNDTCTDNRNNNMTVDVVYLPDTGESTGNDACQAVFGKNADAEFWPDWYTCP